MNLYKLINMITKSSVKTTPIALTISISIALVSCGSGHKKSSAQNHAPVGPISHANVIAQFPNKANNTCPVLSNNNTVLKYLNTPRQSNLTDSACGSLLDDSGALTGFFSFLPEAGPVLGVLSPILSLFGGSADDACTQQEIQQINTQLANQESQIQNIVSTLALDQNQFYQQNYKTAAAIAGINQENYSQAITNLIGAKGSSLTLGIFGNFMIILQLWLSDGTANPVVNDSSYMSNYLSTQSQIMNDAQDAILGQQTQFQSYLSNISGSGYFSCAKDCYLNVTQSNNSALTMTLQSLYNSLEANIAYKQQTDTDFITLLDQYNNTIASMYQQSVYALNDAFQMEYLINQLNYYNAMNYIASKNSSNPSSLQQLGSFSNISATHYNYAQESCTSQIIYNYNQAQQQLALFYASLTNQTYNNVANYIVSDLPIQEQAWPTRSRSYNTPNGVITDNNILKYASVVGINVPVKPMGNIPQSMKNSNWVNNAIIYQYSGIQNINSCTDAIQTSASKNISITNILNSATCPSIFTDINGNPENLATCDFNSNLRPYYIGKGMSQVVLGGNVANMVNNCNPNPVNNSSGQTVIPAYNFYWYTPTPGLPIAGNTYLMCGNWPAVNTSFYGMNYTSSQFNANYWGPVQNSATTKFPSVINLSSSSNQPFILTSNNNQTWTNNVGDTVTSLVPNLGNYTNSLMGDNNTEFYYTTLQYIASDGFIGSVVIGLGDIYEPYNTNFINGQCGPMGGMVALQQMCIFINGNINPALNNVQISGQPLTTLTFQNGGYGNYNYTSQYNFFNYSLLTGNKINYFIGASSNGYQAASANISVE